MDDSLVSESQLPEAAETNDTDLSIAQPAEENDANDNANPADTSLALDSPRLDQTEQQPIQQEQEQPLPTTDEKQQEHFLTEEEDDKMMNELAEESMEEQDELEENRLHLLQLYKEALDDREKLHSQYARQQMRVYPIIKKVCNIKSLQFQLVSNHRVINSNKNDKVSQILRNDMPNMYRSIAICVSNWQI